MALAPVALFSDPLEDYAANWIKFYEQGTTTPLAMAIDSTGSPTVAKAEISSGGTVPIGFVKTAGDVIFIPYVDQAYDLFLFPTEAEADANDTSNAIQLADNVDPFGVATLPNLILPSSQVNYEAGNNFTGGVTRTQEVKNGDIISVKDFGATGDGVTDDAANIRAALTYAVANTPATLVFPATTYKCDTELGDYFASDLVIEGAGAILDFSDVSFSPPYVLLSFTGTIGSEISLTSNANSLQKTVAVNSSTFTVGDFVKIRSDTVWDSLRTGSLFGELNFVETIPDGISLTTTSDLAATYTTADLARIQKIDPVSNITIRGLTLQGPLADDNSKGIIFTYGVNCTVDGIQSYDIDATHVQFFDCTFCRVTDSLFQESNAPTNGYGISFRDATQDCSAENNVFNDVRHSLSTNNTSAASNGAGITRRILFQGNIVTDSATNTGDMSGGDAIDTHAGAEDISIIGNTVNSSSAAGINVECRSAIITDNIISNTEGNGITHKNWTDFTGRSNISNNTIYKVGGFFCIGVLTESASFGTCVISGNITDETDSVGIRAIQDAGFQFVSLTISGNSVRMSGTGLSPAIEVDNALSCSITGNTVRAPSVGIRASESNNVAVSGNSVRLAIISGGAVGYGVRLESNCFGCSVTGNTMLDDSDLTSSNAVKFDDTVTFSGIFSNSGAFFTATTKFDIGAGTGNVKANNIEGV